MKKSSAFFCKISFAWWIAIAAWATILALAADETKTLLQHVTRLASDDFEGRAPGTEGERKTVNYLAEQLKALGLQPAGRNGFFQDVPLVGIISAPEVSFGSGTATQRPAFRSDYVLWSRRPENVVALTNSPLVFAGYGVIAPEFGWNDYAGLDVRGKTVVVLVNDPPVVEATNVAALDTNMFKGRAMTYYGRWTYKFEEAARQGAAAAFIVHETRAAAYPWFVVVASNSRENFTLDQMSGPQLQAEGWLTTEAAKKLFAASGKDFDALKASAARRGFKPVDLAVTGTMTISNVVRRIASKNVVATLPAPAGELAQEHLIYSAHWDALGRDASLSGDQIYNGALDNAAGAAVLLEVAARFATNRAQLKRSITFLFPTAEEKGLLGANYYVAHPLIPLDRTVANLNVEGMNVWGLTRDVEVVGPGQTTLEDILATAAKRQGRNVVDDPNPERGGYFRSDHFEFVRRGVPALYFRSGTNFIGTNAAAKSMVREQFIARDYHKVTDDVRSDWDLQGAMRDVELLFEVGSAVATNEHRPTWKPGAEFGPRAPASSNPRR